MAEAPILNLTGWDNAQLFQAWCVNPPIDYCPPQWGACPNGDVTGYGQQASVYITEVLFSFLVAFWPEKIRATIYAHLTLIFSLQISALIGLLQGSLTQNDAVFILVIATSPTSVYIWFSTFVSVWDRKLFPVVSREKDPDSERAAKAVEVRLLKGLSLLSLVIQVVLVLTMYIPSNYINFSQPACYTGYGRKALFRILWPISFLLQLLFSWLVITVYFFLFKMVRGARDPCSTPDTSSDVMTWVEGVMVNVLGSAHDRRSILVPCLLAILQYQTLVLWIPVPGVLSACQFLTSCFGIVWSLCFRRRIDTEFWILFVLALLSVPDLVLSILAQIPSFPLKVAPYAPFASDLVIAGICIPTLWKRLGASRSWLMLFYTLTFIIGLGALMGVEGFWWTYDFVLFGTSPIYSWNLTPLQRLRDLLSGLFGLANIPWLFVAWLTTSRWSNAGKWVTWKEWKGIWYVTVERAHLFKFGLLVVYPNALWISATIATDPTAPTGYTIGQTFAVLVSVGSIMCFIVDICELTNEDRSAIFWAVLKSTKVRPGGEETSEKKSSDPEDVRPLSEAFSSSSQSE